MKQITLILLTVLLASCAAMRPGERDYYINDAIIELSKEIK